MENIANFKNFINIGEKLFEHLDFKTILDCKLVCQSWNMILTNPMFWLKKLKKMGQSFEASKKWIDLISKSKELEVSTLEITKALIIMHKSVTTLINNYCMNHVDFEKSKENILAQPPVVSAAKLGLTDVMKVLAQMAVVNENEEMVKLLIQHGTKIDAEVFIWNVFHCAIEYGHLDLVKKMASMMNYANEPYDVSTVRKAILCGQIEVLKYLTPLSNQFKIQYGITHAMKQKSTDALKVLLPHANDQTMKTVYEIKIPTYKRILNIIAEELKRRNIKKF